MAHQSPTVLVVEDDPLIRRTVSESLDRHGYRPLRAADLTGARKLLAEQTIDMIVADLRLPDGEGLDLLAQNNAEPPPPFLLISGEVEVEDTLRAMRLGVADCLTKPFAMKELCRVVDQTIGPVEALDESPAARPVDDQQAKGPVIASQSMAAIFATAGKVAPSHATVLVEGPSGTGKEVLARYIHNHSNRADGPFVAVNCAALPESLLESELFGHERGAFSGAIRRHLGRFEQAHKGTLLLDEIGEMALPLQAKLLRALQEGQVDRVGSDRPIKVDVRIVATTNQPLQRRVDEGRFRLDLYYRLNVIRLNLPPLRQRREEIVALVRHFLAQFGSATGQSTPSLTAEVEAGLMAHDWPGNVRELENAVHRALLLGNHSHLVLTDFLEPGESSAAPSPEGTVRSMEQELILSTLRENAGNRSRTAETLGISVRTLRNRLRSYRDQGLAVTPARSAG